MIATLVLTALAVTIAQVNGHIAMEEPPARNVIWRMKEFKADSKNLISNPNDDYLVCAESGGNDCPPCGDSVGEKPYAHQPGGLFFSGIIVREYTMGERINVFANVTRSHGGHVEFKICPNNNMGKPVSQKCLDQYPLRVIKGNDQVLARYDDKEEMNLELELPQGLECEQCVLQMTYLAEQFKPRHVMFRNCADVTIVGRSHNRRPHNPRFQG